MATKTGGWVNTNQNSYSCNCIGPQDGKPLCPCRMRNLRIEDGRYVEIIDHGPAPSPNNDNHDWPFWRKLLGH